MRPPSPIHAPHRTLNRPWACAGPTFPWPLRDPVPSGSLAPAPGDPEVQAPWPHCLAPRCAAGNAHPGRSGCWCPVDSQALGFPDFPCWHWASLAANRPGNLPGLSPVTPLSTQGVSTGSSGGCRAPWPPQTRGLAWPFLPSLSPCSRPPPCGAPRHCHHHRWSWGAKSEATRIPGDPQA